MPKVFLHIGMYKTGTSAFQVFMRDHRDWLARHGIFVPSVGQAPGGAHHAVVRAISGLPSGRHNMLVQQLSNRKLLSAFRKELKAAGDPDIVVSSESMSTLMQAPELLRRFHDYFSSIGYSVSVVCLMRSPPGSWNSGYSQRVKTLNYSASFAHFVEEKLPGLRMLGGDKLSLWENLARQESWEKIIRPYNAEVRRVGAVPAILEAMGITSAPPAGEPRVNRSPGPEKIYVCRQFSKRFEADGVRFMLGQRRKLIAALERIPFNETKSYSGMTPELWARVQPVLDDWRDYFAKKTWGKSWFECFPDEAGAVYVANDLDLVPREEVDWERIKGLEQQLQEAWRVIKTEKGSKSDVQAPLSIPEAMRAMGIDV